MDDEDKMRSRWSHGQFPFDAAKCGNCLTEHATLGLGCGHSEIGEAVRAMGLRSLVENRNGTTGEFLIANYEELLALREKFSSFYG